MGTIGISGEEALAAAKKATNNLASQVNGIFDPSKPVKANVWFSFDAPNYDSRATILAENGFRGCYAFRNDANLTSVMKRLIAEGHDYSVYSGDNTATKPANTASVAEWVTYIEPVITYLNNNGIYGPILYSCSSQFCTGNQMLAAKKLGFKYVRCATVDPNNTGSSAGYIYPKVKDFNPLATYVKANAISQGVVAVKGLIDDAITNNYTLCLFSHTYSQDGYTEAEFKQVVEYIKAKVNAGVLDCLTPRQYYDRYRHEYDFRKALIDIQALLDQ